MTKAKQIVTDCINGCTVLNLDERRMHFKVNYYVNESHGNGTPGYVFVHNIDDLEDAINNVITENIDIHKDVVIHCITVRNEECNYKVNKTTYAYCLYDLLQKALRQEVNDMGKYSLYVADNYVVITYFINGKLHQYRINAQAQ